MHLCRHLAKYRHIVSDPNGRVPKSSTYHNNNYAQFLRRRFSAFQLLPRIEIMISKIKPRKRLLIKYKGHSFFCYVDKMHG